jgi:hypothetical protein
VRKTDATQLAFSLPVTVTLFYNSWLVGDRHAGKLINHEGLCEPTLIGKKSFNVKSRLTAFFYNDQFTQMITDQWKAAAPLRKFYKTS